MGIKVRVKNTTNISFKIQEGNAGVFATRRVLKPQEEYTLDLDTNATYREYVLITLPNNTPIQQMFSSDDVAEFKEIVIKGDMPQYFWEGILRGENSEGTKSSDGGEKSEGTESSDQPKQKAVPVEGSNTPAPAPRVGWLQKIRKFF